MCVKASQLSTWLKEGVGGADSRWSLQPHEPKKKTNNSTKMKTPAGEGFTVNISIITRREEPVLITAPLLMWRKLNWKIEFLMWLKWFSDVSWGGSEVEKKKGRKKKNASLFSGDLKESWLFRGKKTHIGGCVSSSPWRLMKNARFQHLLADERHFTRHSVLRLEMLISPTKTPLVHICKETMGRRGVSCVPASECGLMCADTMFSTLDGARRMNRVYCNLQHKGDGGGG